MRPYKDSGIKWIGEIPESWQVCKIKNLCTTVYSGGTPDSTNMQYWDGDIPWIPSGSCHDTLITEAPKSITRLGYENSSTKILPANTTVMAMTGATCGNVGFVTFETCMNQSVTGFIVKKSHCSKFLFYCLFAAREEVLTHKTGGAQSGINVEDCKSIMVPFIPYAEQQRITDYLDEKCEEIDSLICLQEQMMEKLKAYKQSVITEAVTKGLNPNAKLIPSGIDWIGNIPEGWKVVPLKWILRNPLQYGANESGVLYDESLPRYVRITDILNNNLREDLQKLSLTEKQASGYILEDNDILFARSGATVGKAFIYKSNYGRCAFAGYLIRAQINSSYNSKFIYYYTQSSSYDEWKKRIFIQSTIQNIGADRYSILEIPIPLLPDQQAIVNYLDEKCADIDHLIAIKQQKIDKLKDYKKSVIFEAVTGKTIIE